jgi:hypothetical protein
MKKMIIAAAFALAATAAPANAALTIDASQVGNSFSFVYNGFDNPNGGSGTIAGLSAEATFTLASVSGTSFTFDYVLDNTSTSPVTGVRVSSFGFDTSPDVTGATTNGTLFSNVALSGNIPNIPPGGTNPQRTCFFSSGGNCAGAGGSGLFINDTPADASFTLTFGTGVTSFTMDRFFVRYQSLNYDDGTIEIIGGSASGLGTESVIPEPATWAMLIAGFGMIGAAMRRRRNGNMAIA